MSRRRSDSAISTPGSVETSPPGSTSYRRSASDRRNPPGFSLARPGRSACAQVAASACARARRRRRAAPSAPGRAWPPEPARRSCRHASSRSRDPSRTRPARVGRADRNDEDLGVRGPGRDRLLGQAADLADVAVGVDRSRDRDPLAAGQLAGRQRVDDRQRHRQTGRRPADVAGVEPDVERDVDSGAPSTTPMMRVPCSDDHGNLDGHRSDRPRMIRERDRRADRVRSLHDLREVVVAASASRAVGRDDPVARLEVPSPRRKPAGRSATTRPGQHGHVIAERCQRGDPGGRLRLRHVADVLLVGLLLAVAAGDVDLLDEIDVGVELGLHPAPQD